MGYQQKAASRNSSVEMKYLRRAKGITKKDRIGSEIIRKELEIKSTLSRIGEKQLNRYGHLIRMPASRQVKKSKGLEQRTIGRFQKK